VLASSIHVRVRWHWAADGSITTGTLNSSEAIPVTIRRRQAPRMTGGGRLTVPSTLPGVTSSVIGCRRYFAAPREIGH
jgi:hypothetical protein